jgi:uncharacterized protein (DUF1501 family)
MSDSKNISLSRRHFLKHSGALASAAGVGMPMVMNMLVSPEAMAATGGSYKALVCVFLAGGNDSHNTVIRTDKGLARFVSARPTVGAEVQTDGTALAPLNMGSHPNLTGISGLSLALHPTLANVKSYFESGRLAIIGNVGPLMEPTLASAVANGSAKMPPKLSSHNDQTSIWQSGYPEGAISGWGGEMVRRFGETNKVEGQTSQLFSAVAIETSPVFCAGTNQNMPGHLPVVSPFGAAAKDGGALRPGGLKGDNAPYTVHWYLPRDVALSKLFKGEAGRSELGAGSAKVAHLIESDYLAKMKGAEQAWSTNSQATANVTLSRPIPEGNSLAEQLAVVVKMIKASNNAPLALGRQVFYVQLNGFDTHSGQVGPMSPHKRLLKKLDDALKFFDDELGSDREKVLTFTASEFGRKLNENGDGTDHGWGGHHFVMGGGVKGGVYGHFPDLSTWSDAKAAYGDDEQVLPDGTMVPQVAVDLYAKELGKWLGIDWSDGTNKQVASILFPNLDQKEPLLGFTG